MNDMARCIDADELLNRLPDDLPYKGSVKRVLIQAPDADVVPKSEVERLEKDNEDLRNVLTNTINKYRNCEAELAREIFEEIEKCMEHDYISSIGVYNGALRLRIAALKKKYTGGKYESNTKSNIK